MFVHCPLSLPTCESYSFQWRKLLVCHDLHASVPNRRAGVTNRTDRGGQDGRAIRVLGRALRATGSRGRGQSAYASSVTNPPIHSADRAVRDATLRSVAPAERFPLTRRDISFIVGFWLIYALLTIANHAFDPGPPDSRPSLNPLSTWIAIALAEAALWALLTPLVVSLSVRVGADRQNRVAQFLFFTVLGVAIALGVSVIGHATRDALLQRPSDSIGGRSHGPPLWFGIFNALVIYLGVLAAGVARAYSLRFRARREQATQLQAQLAEARLEALRSQLDPHFLFNTLNAVSTLVERDPRGVRRMITRLSELLRYTMEGAREPEITLRRELDLIDRYLDIMEVRFPGLNVMRLLEDRSLDMLVPSMVLQPLVENAIRHGVEKMTEPGRIEIETVLEGDSLVLRVSDNGPEAREGAGGRGGGVGLRNTIARLQQLYGDAGSFALERRGDVTVAEVRIPAHNGSELRVQGTETTGDAGE
jgi:two-component system LytT family sensor kinase